ncbi:MAG: tryptophan--tRNA ligase [Candidatus Hydrogenedentes bacterium]|nr:tryptophan--tRNA ligase [Candidatus Hydrogenedentota bacterium]
MGKERVFSGIQPSGRPHLGNYLGAMRQHVQMQDQYDCIFGVVNYHALTSVHNGDELQEYTMEMVVDYLAVGLDPDKCLIMKQSDVPEHTELAWLLSTVTPVSWVERCPTYKEKKLQQAADVNFGLLAYPVLMAADILIYRAEVVPVGKDQLPHLELTREITRAFNRVYGETFPEPQSLVNEETATVLGTDGVKKMSKSVGNTIEIFDEPEELKETIMGMVTDTSRVYRTDPGHPDICNVFSFHKIFTPDRAEEIRQGSESAKLGCVECTEILAARMEAYFAPMRARRAKLLEDPDCVRDVLETSARKARKIAAETMNEVRRKMGID